MEQVNAFEAVKRRADIVLIAEKFTGLKATGRGNHRQLPECPFCKGHGCFSISIDKQLFNCFQCPGGSSGGDVFTFLSRLKGYDLQSALKEIAMEVGYTLPTWHQGTKPGIRDVIMDQAKADWSLPEAKPFREYLVSIRQLSEEVLRGHDVGYLRDRSNLISDLKKKGYSYEEIKASGILTQGFAGLYRIIFGWRGLDGKVAGFVGAATKGQLEKLPPSEKGQFPKYKKNVNFKAAAPYNLYYARRRVPEDHSLVIVEGIVDCLHLLSIGIDHVIALGGSAFKEEFTKALQTTRFKRLILFFDSDTAGSDCTERTIHLLLKGSKYSLYVAQIAAADPKDPSRIIKD
ncbi:MAG: toprim domain-containing protein, partial [Nitrospiria bacterium]